MKRNIINNPENKVKIGDVYITSTPQNQLLTKISTSLNKSKIFITTPNPEMVVEAQKNIKFRNAINSSDIALPDGIGLVLANKFLSAKKSMSQIRGREYFIDLLKIANKNKMRVYLLGASSHVNKLTAKKIREDFSDINLQSSSGFKLIKSAKPISDKELIIENKIISEINKFKPHMLFVAFGAPKQEIWISKHLQKLNVNLAMGVGGSFDYFSGEIVLPPKCMSRMGLEWLWRLIIQPSRIKRIFKAIIIFPTIVVRQKLRN